MLAKLGLSMHGGFCFRQTTAPPSTVPKKFPWPMKLFEERCTWNEMVLGKQQLKVLQHEIRSFHRLLTFLHASLTKYIANKL